MLQNTLLNFSTFNNLKFTDKFIAVPSTPKLVKKLKQRVGLFASITGTIHHPRANNELSLKIMKAMIEPVIYYAPSALCSRPQKYFEDQDKFLAKAGRLALHIPKTIGRKYVQENASISPSKERTLELALQYITNDKRSPSVKESFEKSKPRNPPGARHQKTPGEAIYYHGLKN